MARRLDGNGKDAVINGVFYAFGAAILALVAWGLWHVWDDLTSPVWKLRKDQWVCTDSRTWTSTRIDGRYSLYAHTTTKSVCTQYSRKGG